MDYLKEVGKLLDRWFFSTSDKDIHDEGVTDEEKDIGIFLYIGVAFSAIVFVFFIKYFIFYFIYK